MTNEKEFTSNPLDINQIAGVLKRRFWLVFIFGLIGAGLAFAFKSRVTASYTMEVYLLSKVTTGKMMAKAINHMTLEQAGNLKSVKAESLGSNVVAVKLNLHDTSSANGAIEDLTSYLNAVPAFARELEIAQEPLDAKLKLHRDQLELIEIQLDKMKDRPDSPEPVSQLIYNSNLRDKANIQKELITLQSVLDELCVFKSLDLADQPSVKVQRPSVVKRYISYVGFMLFVGYVIAFFMDSRKSNHG